MRISNSLIRTLLAAVALVSLSGILQSAPTVTGSNCGAVDRLTIALRFAQILYPELKGKEFSVTFVPGTGPFISSPTDTSDFRLRFDKPIWHPTVNGKLQPDTEQSQATVDGGIELPFDLYFYFIRPDVSARELTCHPVKFTSEAGHKQMERVRSAIEPHPEWSDEEELKVARKLGMLYGPDDSGAILQRLPLKELAEFYGSLQVKNIEFRMNGGTKCTGCSFVNPSWYITLSEVGTPRGLLVVVEPFFGKITSVSE
jgi:hypothetical protein